VLKERHLDPFLSSMYIKVPELEYHGTELACNKSCSCYFPHSIRIPTGEYTRFQSMKALQWLCLGEENRVH